MRWRRYPVWGCSWEIRERQWEERRLAIRIVEGNIDTLRELNNDMDIGDWEVETSHK